MKKKQKKEKKNRGQKMNGTRESERAGIKGRKILVDLGETAIQITVYIQMKFPWLRRASRGQEVFNKPTGILLAPFPPTIAY